MQSASRQSAAQQSASQSDDRSAGRSWSAVRRLVAGRATGLARTIGQSRTTATLAHLRANIGREPGEDPAIWWVTIDDVPGEPRSDDPTREELAVHHALTLFALHQQSRAESAHVSGVGLGRAVALLDRAHGADSDDAISPVRRRFDAVVTSASLPELAHHLRGIVSQLRSEGIGLDYGMLADDILTFQFPGRSDDVRRRWARQFYHLGDEAVSAADITVNPKTEEPQ